MHHSDDLIENPPNSDYEKNQPCSSKILKRLKSLILMSSSKTHILMWKKLSFPRKTRKKIKIKANSKSKETKKRTNKKVFNTRNENRFMDDTLSQKVFKILIFFFNLFFCPT